MCSTAWVPSQLLWFPQDEGCREPWHYLYNHGPWCWDKSVLLKSWGRAHSLDPGLLGHARDESVGPHSARRDYFIVLLFLSANLSSYIPDY